MNKHINLLGESILDNGAYVHLGQADVTAHLERKLPHIGWTLDMRAMDGAIASGVEGQLARSPVTTPCTFDLSI